MSKGLRNMSKDERKAAISRRVSSGTKGLGYYGALDAMKKQESENNKAAKHAGDN